MPNSRSVVSRRPLSDRSRLHSRRHRFATHSERLPLRGCTAQDRVKKIHRVAEVSCLMVDAGLIVLVSFISPFCSERRMAGELFTPAEFFKVFVDAPLAEAEPQDVRGCTR